MGIGYQVIPWNIISHEENNSVRNYEINRFTEFKDINDRFAGEIK